MEINKVIYGNETLIDLTEDTVNSSNLPEGITAHDATGKQFTGTLTHLSGDIAVSEKGQPGGVATLDSYSVLDKNQLPLSVTADYTNNGFMSSADKATLDAFSSALDIDDKNRVCSDDGFVVGTSSSSGKNIHMLNTNHDVWIGYSNAVSNPSTWYLYDTTNNRSVISILEDGTRSAYFDNCKIGNTTLQTGTNTSNVNVKMPSSAGTLATLEDFGGVGFEKLITQGTTDYGMNVRLYRQGHTFTLILSGNPSKEIPASTNVDICTLPSGFRPGAQFAKWVKVTSTRFVLLQFNTTGVIRISNVYDNVGNTATLGTGNAVRIMETFMF